MADKTGIEWTDASWNPVTGCDKVSPGCDHCYALTFAERWRGTAGHYFENGFDVQLRPDKLDLPMRWKKPRKVFVNSMSDLFHDQVPDRYIAKVFATMALAPRHTFQVLTKRHARMRSLLTSAAWHHMLRVEVNNFLAARIEDYRSGRLPASWGWPLPNLWLGVSVENQKWADIRIPALLNTPAAVRWISAEPLLGPVDLQRITPTRTGGPLLRNALRPILDRDTRRVLEPRLDWVVVGGESGRGARPMAAPWARHLLDQCRDNDIPFLFKQWGEYLGQNTGPYRGEPDLYVDSATGEVRAETDVPSVGTWNGVWKVGKKEAGRLLEGTTWDQYPQAVTA